MLLRAALFFTFTTVLSLECYKGIEGNKAITVVDQRKMCIYETNAPCDFKTLPATKKNFYVSALGKSVNRCWTGRRALCACNTDRCNGNFELMLKYWLASKNANIEQKNCVAEYLRKKANLVATASSNVLTTKELKSVKTIKTTASKRTTKSLSLPSDTRSTPKFVVKSEAATSPSQTAGTPLASKTIVEETDAPLTDKSEIASGTTDEPPIVAPEPDASVEGGSKPKKPKKRGTLTKFLIYGAICIGIVVLVCLVLPVIVVYAIMKKHHKVPKAAMQKKGQTGTATTSSTTNMQQTKKSFWKKGAKEKQSSAGKPTKKSQAGNITAK
ncbi:unnamed protein product [Cylicocyclus nassatus]|uniref:Uncharacterized protein n=1 Tax=Cylicocyclus nassatus TaxID=53992 RepID=A0AA36DIC9_CYLNA|nr:unnamed protein product [Cylicocyclus nassatus]